MRTGTITIHAFGAYFGLAVSRAFLSPKPFSLGNSKSNAVSDVLSLLGTTLLWVYWPSFVAATETASPTNTSRCIIHTVFSLLGSTVATFFLSHQLTTTAGTTNNGSIKRNFDPFHIANATLAGGVAAGASARLDMTLGGALLLGIVAGTVSVLGFAYISPMLEARLSMYDTCGVHNLHGLPSLVGAVASAIVVSLDSSASFLLFGPGHQALRQIAAIVCTVGLAVASGWLTGFLLVRVVDPEDPAAEYDDAAWWKSDYLVEALTPGNVIDLSHHSRLSVLPVTSVKPDGHD